MATADEIKIRILAKDEATKVFNQTRASADRLKSSLTALKVGIVGMSVASGALIKSVIDTGSQVQNLRLRMRFLTGSTEQGAKAFQAMTQYASKVPFALEDIQAGVPSLLTVAKGTEDLNNLLAITGDLAAASGLSFQETSMQLQRALAGGIASAELFRERGISAMLGFEAGVSYSAKQTREAIVSAFADGTTTVAGAAQAMAGTFTGQVSMMQDAWFQLKMQLADTGLIEEATKAIAQLTEIIADPNFQNGAKTFSTAVLDLFKFTVENWKILTTVGAVWFGAKVGSILGKKGSAIGALTAGLAALIGTQIKAEEPAKDLFKTYEELGLELQKSNEEFAKQNELILAVKSGFEDYNDSIKDTTVELQAAATKGMKRLEDSLVDFTMGTKTAKEAFKDMAQSIISDLIRIYIRQTMLKPLYSAFSNFIGGDAGGSTGATTAAAPLPAAPSVMTPLPAFAGGGFTGMGARSGGLDGKGGFPAMLHPNETVIDHTKGQGGGVVVNQTINVSTGVQQTVRTEIASLMPQIAEASKAAVLDARRRGGSFAKGFGV